MKVVVDLSTCCGERSEPCERSEQCEDGCAVRARCCTFGFLGSHVYVNACCFLLLTSQFCRFQDYLTRNPTPSSRIPGSRVQIDILILFLRQLHTCSLTTY